MAEFLDKLSSKDSAIVQIATISVAIIAIVNAYAFYRNNIWQPTVVVNDVDYQNAIAHLTINGKEFVLHGDSTYNISYDWGIAFGTTYGKAGKEYDRIEILKHGMVTHVVK
jgi:hypothetical protein